MWRSRSTSSIPTASFKRCKGIWTANPSLLFSAFWCECDQLRSFFDEIACREPYRLDDPIGGRGHRMFHLHRFDDHQRLAAADMHTGRDHQLSDASRHWRGEPPGGRVLVGM